MEILQCSQCGSLDFLDNGHYSTCKYCKSVFEHYNRLICDNATISLVDDINSLLKKCREEPHNAKKYANLILDIDPSNINALKYL